MGSTTTDERKVAKRKLKEEERANETPEERSARKAAKRQRLSGKTRSESISESPPRAVPAADRAAPAAPIAAAPKIPAPTLSLAEFAAAHDFKVTDAAATPMVEFGDAPFNAGALRRLRAKYEAPTPTQAVSWPLALAGRDLISVAKTGSGKTLGFLLPAFHHVAEKYGDAPDRGPHPTLPAPRVVVLAPTRELATQIHVEAAAFAPAFAVRTCVLYGGAPKSLQIRQLRTLGARGVVVATPGRLNDMLEAGRVAATAVDVLVLDEADRMLDMGFEPQIRAVADLCPNPRQTLFFTATWEPKVQKVARTLATSADAPARVVFGDAASGKLAANKDITQTLEIVNPADKMATAKAHLATVLADPAKKAIVFVGTKRGCDNLANDLWADGVLCDSLHGDKEQRERTAVVAAYKRNDLRVLVATDVAARGLDITDVTNVLCYDFPAGLSHGIEDYVHRIGRTARAGRKGDAHSLLTRADARTHGRALAQILRDAGQVVPPELEQLGVRKGGGKGGRGKGRYGRGGGFKGGRGGGGGFNKGYGSNRGRW